MGSPQYAIPVSYSPKIGSYISPFHVVHYCIKYSEFSKENLKDEVLLGNDALLNFWNDEKNIFIRI